jgi:hypothetical protein
MKFTLDKIWLLLLLLFALSGAGSAAAQNVSLTSGGFPSVSGHLPGTPVSTQSSVGARLESQINFGDLSANISGRRVRVTVPIRISAKTNYQLELQRVADSGGSVKASDIGFGILNIRPQMGGNPKLSGNALSVSIAGNFGANPVNLPFAATLAAIGENSTVVLTGAPTVADGELGENDNSILVDLTFVIAAQYFTPSDLSALNLMLKISPLP